MPGTHDLELGIDVLSRLKKISEDESECPVLPVFDKSRYTTAKAIAYPSILISLFAARWM